MRKTVRRTQIAIAVGLLVGCSDATSADESGTFYGPTLAMGTGIAHAYVTLDRAGAPTEIGVAFSEATLTALPTDAAEYVFSLPREASATLYQHAVINWMPTGHPPPMIYTVPHFDFHFYTITNAQRTAILLGDSALTAKMTRLPGAEFVPSGYVAGMASVQMGQHWNDPAAPERLGEPFTKTFIYGSYDGVFTFGEPMVAKSYLDTKPATVVTPLKLPARYAAPGYQPTSYTVAYDAGAKEYRVSLTGLVAR